MIKKKLDMNNRNNLSNLDDFIRLIRHICIKFEYSVISIGECNSDNRDMMAKLDSKGGSLEFKYKYYDSILEIKGSSNDDSIKNHWNYIKECVTNINFKAGEKLYYFDGSTYIVLEDTNFSNEPNQPNKKIKVKDDEGNILELTNDLCYRYE